MTVKTHITSSLSLGLLLPVLIKFHYVDIDLMLYLYIAGVVFGAIFPDIDEPHSYIGRRLYFVSEFLSLFIHHRGITHTLLIVGIYALIGYILYASFGFGDFTKSIVIGFLIGNIGHILGDMMTKSGVSLFYPFSEKSYGLMPKPMRFYTGGVTEYLFVLPFFVFLVFFEMYYFDIMDTNLLYAFLHRIFIQGL